MVNGAVKVAKLRVALNVPLPMFVRFAVPVRGTEAPLRLPLPFKVSVVLVVPACAYAQASNTNVEIAGVRITTSSVEYSSSCDRASKSLARPHSTQPQFVLHLGEYSFGFEAGASGRATKTKILPNA
jgi:hypothetical protein